MSVTGIKFLDTYIGTVLCVLFSLFKTKPKEKKYRKILLIQLWGLGETILSLPAMHALRKKYPDARINVLTTKRVRDVFYKNKDIDKLRIIPLSLFGIVRFIFKKFKRYDVVVDMEEYLKVSAIMGFFLGRRRIGYSHGVRSLLYDHTVKYNDKQHVVQTFTDLLKPLGVYAKPSKLLPLHYSKQDEKSVKNLLKKHKITGKFVCISAGAAESSRMRMWQEERWAAVVNELITKRKVKVLLVGADDVRDTNEKILSYVTDKAKVVDLAGETDAYELFALIEKAALLISVDSGPMHVGAAMGTKTIGLFDPNTPVRFGPFGKGNISIYKPVTKKPIINVHLGQVPNSSPYPHMSKIHVKDVMQAVRKLI